MGHAVNAGGNKAPPSTTTGMSASKLDNETEDFKREWCRLKSSVPMPMCTSTSEAAGRLCSRLPIPKFTELGHHYVLHADVKVSSELKQQIIKARTDKKLTQAQLAQQINEKPQTIQEYESGKAIPNPQILSKMSRVLGVVLKKGT